MMKQILICCLACMFFMSTNAQTQPNSATVGDLKITVLSTMLVSSASAGTGEWGFSALVEADTFKLLFDAGGREKTVLENAQQMKLDLSNVQSLLLSHWHNDHTGGWLPLREAMMERNAQGLSRAHVGQGFFDTRVSKNGEELNWRKTDSVKYAQTGGSFEVHTNFREIAPGIFVTGNVPRVFDEKNYGEGRKKNATGQIVSDNIPEDLSLVIRTPKGLVLLSGCGHAGLVNTVDWIKKQLPGEVLLAAIGGFHLLESDDAQVKWTAEQLKAAGIRYFMGAHCTGIEPVYQIRQWAGLKRGECVVGAIGDVFTTEKGFSSRPLTR